MTLPLLALAATVIPAVAPEDVFEVDPARSVVVAASRSGLAAEELKTHLRLMTGVEVATVRAAEVPEGAFVWRVGFAPPDADPLSDNAEESRWQVAADGAWFYGGAEKGDLNAVYDFLENGFGVRWPFGDGVFVKRRARLRMKPLSRVWKPELNIREIRHPKQHPEQGAWSRRMRFGRHDVTPGYGHHFTHYWDRFAKTHPEYFAMRADGKRLPYGVADTPDDIAAAGGKATRRIAMCVSCPGFVDQVVQDWIAEGMPPYINLCENDASAGRVCQCANCRALDAPKPAGAVPAGSWRADRYVDFTNRALAEAKRHRPDVKAWFYAYNAAMDPPRRVRPLPDAIGGLVPTTFSFPYVLDYFRGWQAAGLRHFFYRPNRHWYFRLRYLPLGCEKHFFKEWKCAYDCGAMGFDYDTPGRYGDLEWFRDYVVAKAMQDPTKDFEHWESHYMQAFGEAADDVKDYFRYWREEVWEKRIEGEMDAICIRGKAFNFGRGLMMDLPRYYRLGDFDAAGAFLSKALAIADLSDAARPLVQRLKLANDHARLVFLAVRDKGKGDKAARALFEFRKEHGFTMLPWEECGFDDACGLASLAKAEGYEEEPQWIP